MRTLRFLSILTAVTLLAACGSGAGEHGSTVSGVSGAPEGSHALDPVEPGVAAAAALPLRPPVPNAPVRPNLGLRPEKLVRPGGGGQPQPGVDVFGVTQIYPTKAGGEEWFLADDATGDPRFDPQDPITRNGDGSWKMENGQVRMHAMTSTGYDSGAIATYDRDTLAVQGYMQAPNDWKNVEMTGFVKVNAAQDASDNFAWYARGGRHSDPIACEGSAYKGSLHYDGRVRFQKESWHVSYDQSPYESATRSIVGRWVGFKTVIRNEVVNGDTQVRLELYLNDNADGVTWAKVYDMVDDGSWGGDSGNCGASDPAMAMTWGGPLATFRWDNADDVDFKWLSVREID